MRNLYRLFGGRFARAAVAAVVAALGAASAQTNAATLRGTVLDSTSAVIPGAEAVLASKSGGAPRRADADATGVFEFASLPPGSYSLRVVAEGFSEKRLEALTLAEGERLEVTIRLTPEMLSQNVTVSAARTETPLSALPNAVTLLDKESIDQQRTLSDNLSSVPARTVPSFGPSLQKLAGRGESLRGRNPLYLINGVPRHNALRDGRTRRRLRRLRDGRGAEDSRFARSTPRRASGHGVFGHPLRPVGRLDVENAVVRAESDAGSLVLNRVPHVVEPRDRPAEARRRSASASGRVIPARRKAKRETRAASSSS